MRIKIIVFTLLCLFLGVGPVLASSALINEVMISPSSGNSEWVELYNPDNLDLSTYWIDDDTSFSEDSGSSSKKSLASIISNNQTYPYIELSSSIFNNSGDFVVLFSSDGTLVDQYEYTSNPGTDVALGRSPDGGSWSTLASISKGSTNGSSSTPTPSPTPAPTETPTPTPTASLSFTIHNAPPSLNSDQSFKIKIELSIPSNPSTEYYLKGAFKKSDVSRYLGLTKKNSDWIEYGDDYTEQYKISTDSSGKWSGEIEVKIDIYDNDYKGSGDYIFKVGRLTSSGSGPTWSNETTIKVTSVESTPTPTPTPTPLPSKKESATPSATPKLTATPSAHIEEASVAGITEDSLSEVEVKESKQFHPIILIGCLILFSAVGYVGFIYFRKKI